MSKAEQWTARPVPDEPGSVPLPRFELPTLEAIDTAPTSAGEPWGPFAGAPSTRASSAEEICADDILEEVPAAGALSALESEGEEPEIEILAEDTLEVSEDDYASPSLAVAGDTRGSAAKTLPPSTWDVSPRGEVFTIRSIGDSSPSVDIRSLPDVRTSHITPSFLPVAFDLSSLGSPGPAPTPSALPSKRTRTARVGVAVAVVAAAGLLGVVFMLRAASAKSVAPRGAIAAADREPDAPAVASGSPEQAPATPPTSQVAPNRTDPTSVSVASLPQSPVGTVTIAAIASAHRLYIDGVVAPRGHAVVSCGKHVVKVGSRGRTQVIDVPCGGEIVAEPY